MEFTKRGGDFMLRYQRRAAAVQVKTSTRKSKRNRTSGPVHSRPMDRKTPGSRDITGPNRVIWYREKTKGGEI